MKNDNLLIGGAAIILVLLAIPIIGPMVLGPKGYDPEIDTPRIAQLNHAVEDYARANGHYPPSLFYLSPDYLKEIPLTSTNLQFEYDARTGKITNPSEPVVVPPPDAKEERKVPRAHKF